MLTQDMPFLWRLEELQLWKKSQLGASTPGTFLGRMHMEVEDLEINALKMISTWEPHRKSSYTIGVSHTSIWKPVLQRIRGNLKLLPGSWNLELTDGVSWTWWNQTPIFKCPKDIRRCRDRGRWLGGYSKGFQVQASPTAPGDHLKLYHGS